MKTQTLNRRTLSGWLDWLTDPWTEAYRASLDDEGRVSMLNDAAYFETLVFNSRRRRDAALNILDGSVVIPDAALDDAIVLQLSTQTDDLAEWLLEAEPVLESLANTMRQTCENMVRSGELPSDFFARVDAVIARGRGLGLLPVPIVWALVAVILGWAASYWAVVPGSYFESTDKANTLKREGEIRGSRLQATLDELDRRWRALPGNPPPPPELLLGGGAAYPSFKWSDLILPAALIGGAILVVKYGFDKK